MDHIKKINLIYVIFSTIKESCQMNSIRTYNAKPKKKKKNQNQDQNLTLFFYHSIFY